jgi:hypothetical protein
MDMDAMGGEGGDRREGIIEHFYTERNGRAQRLQEALVAWGQASISAHAFYTSMLNRGDMAVSVNPR